VVLLSQALQYIVFFYAKKQRFSQFLGSKLGSCTLKIASN